MILGVETLFLYFHNTLLKRTIQSFTLNFVFLFTFVYFLWKYLIVFCFCFIVFDNFTDIDWNIVMSKKIEVTSKKKKVFTSLPNKLTRGKKLLTIYKCPKTIDITGSNLFAGGGGGGHMPLLSPPPPLICQWCDTNASEFTELTLCKENIMKNTCKLEKYLQLYCIWLCQAIKNKIWLFKKSN